MAHIVLDNCIRCKYTDCVDVCPVDCFREGPNMLVIDPDECIDCAVCVPECPAEAIVAEEDVPGDQENFIAINAEKAPNWPAITRSKSPLEDADDWNGTPNKLPHPEGRPWRAGVPHQGAGGPRLPAGTRDRLPPRPCFPVPNGHPADALLPPPVLSIYLRLGRNLIQNKLQGYC